MRPGAGLILSILLSACGGTAAVSSAAPTATATPAATPTQTPTATTAPVAGAAAVWTVGAGSKAVVSVREQLVGVSLPSDAVLTATGAAGSFGIRADGTFSPDSKISFDLTTLQSDSRDRDNFVKQDTLQTRQFPKAEFVPLKASGLTLPLAASGTFTFTLTGDLTVHGKTKTVSFDVVATRSGADLTATATLKPTITFEDFGMKPPAVAFRVVSIVDEIRLVVQLVATGPAT